MGRVSFKDFKNEALQDPEVRAEYEKLKPAYDLRRKLIELRIKAGMTQEDLAQRLHTQKSNISRLENVNTKNSPRLSTIEDYAHAIGYDVEIKFVPSK
jgi:DNA-binding XRE family transcriptional regulator